MKGRIAIIILLFLMALVLMCAAFVFYYQGEYLPFINKVVTLPYVEKPAPIAIKEALNNIKEVSTATYELDTKSSWLSFGSPFELDTSVIFDGRFEDKPRGKLKVNNDIKIQNLTFLTSFNASLSEDKIFFEVTETPALPFLDIKDLKDKWYEADWELIDFGNFNKIYNNIHQYFRIVERLPDQTINGELSYHYLIKTDPEKFINFSQLLPEDGVIKDIFKQENYNQFTLDIWISKNNIYLLKVLTNFSNADLNTQLELNISNYNEPIALEKPEQGASLNTLVKDVFGSSNLLDITVFSYLVGIEDEYLVSDKDEDKLYLIWEDLFHTNDNLSDTDNDGYNDLDEIKSGHNPNGAGRILE